MTTPAYDSPDWRVLAQAAPFTNIFLQPLAAATTYGPFYVGDLPYLHIVFLTMANRGQVTLTWWADAAATIQTGTDSYVCGVTGTVSVVVPIVGPYVTVKCEANAYPDTHTIITSSVAKPRSFTSVVITEPPVLISSVGTAVGAGATVDLDSFITIPGLAHVSVYSTLATFLVRVSAPDMAGAFQRIATWNQTAPFGPMLLYLPSRPVRVSFVNNTGGAGTFDASLVCRTIMGA